MTMRHLSLTLTPPDGSLYPADEIYSRSNVERELLFHINLLSDGTITAIYRMRGDARVLGEYYEENPDILEYDIFGVEDQTYHVYVHVAEGYPATQLLRIAEKNNLIIDTPIVFNDESITVSVYGEPETLRKTVHQIPDDLKIEIESMSEYSPDEEPLIAGLTDRQLEVLELAVSDGYYDVPRRANSKELAEKLGCAPSTVSEHLRKIEAHVLSSLVR